MSPQSVPALVMASIAFYVGGYHLLLHLRKPRPRYNLTFGLTCLSLGFFDMFSVGLFNVTTAADSVGWLHLISLAGALAGVFFLHFVADFTERRIEWLLRLISLCFLPIILAALWRPAGWLWSDEPFVRVVHLPLGWEVTYREVAGGPLTTIHLVVYLMVIAYAFWAGVRLLRDSQRQKAVPLLVALTLFSLGILNDAAVTLGFYNFVYLCEYSFLGMVLLMTLYLANEVHKAAGMEGTLRESERRLAETNIMLQLVLDAIPVRVFWKDRNSVYLGCNRLFAEDAGRNNPSELIGEDDFAMGWRNEAEMYRADDRRVIESGESQINYEEPQTTPAGDKIWVRTSKVPLRNPEDDVIGVLGTYEDITHRKRQEEALRQSEENLTITLNSIGDGVIATDAEGKITGINPVAEQLTGWTAAAAVGRPLKDVFRIVDAATLADVESPAEAVLRDGEEVDFHSGWLLVADDGTERQIADSAAPIRAADGTILGAVLVFRDVTDELALQEQLRHAQKMEAIGQLAGGVAHDFNNLLQAIQGYTETARTILPRNHPAHLDLIEVQKAVDRAAALTKQLLAFGRRDTLQRKYLNLNVVVGDMTKMLRRVIGEQVELDVRTAPGLETVYADPGQIEQVLANLCINARDAMPDGGSLNLTTANIHIDVEDYPQFPWAQAGDYVALTVTDTGQGIPIENQGRIFEPFFTTKEVGGGTGLGLATVWAIIERHGGMIEFKSKEGLGTTFSIYLPATAERPTAAKASTVEAGIEGGDETILVAEDDAMVCNLTVKILERAGYQVIVARDGAEAIDLFERFTEEIALAILDVVMPRKGGREVYESIKARRPDVPVLFHSGYSYEAIGRDHLPEGEYHLIQKPYQPQDLLQRVHHLIRARV